MDMASWQAAVRGVPGVPRMLITASMALVAAGVAVVAARVVVAGPGFSFAMTIPGGLVALFGAAAALIVAGALDSGFHRGRRLGLLLYLAGCAWMMAEWDNPAGGSAVVFSLGLALYAACPAALVHAALSYPTGRLSGRTPRALVLAGYLITIGVLGVGSALFFVPALQGCPSCPQNLLAIADAPQVTETLTRIGVWSGLIWLVTVGGLLVSRLFTASAAGLRTIGPVVGCGFLYVLAVGVEFGRSLDRGFLGSNPTDGTLWLLQSISIMLLSAAILAQLRREQLRHRALTRLVVDLGAGTGPGHLRAALSERLGDPRLAIAYPVGHGRHTDADGRPMDPLPEPGPGVTELHSDEVHLATLLHRPGLLGSTDQVDDLISAVHLALEHERLQAQGLAHLAELRSSGIRIVGAGDDERRRLERDLHDGAQQRLVGLALGLRLLRSRIPAEAGAIDAAQDELRMAIGDLRALAKGLHPVVLRDAGLATALRALSESRPLRIGELSADRYPGVHESTAYLFVDRISSTGPVTVAFRSSESSLVVDAKFDAEFDVGRVPLGEVADRVVTLEGTITRGFDDGKAWLRLTLPLTGDEGNSRDENGVDRTLGSVVGPTSPRRSVTDVASG